MAIPEIQLVPPYRREWNRLSHQQRRTVAGLAQPQRRVVWMLRNSQPHTIKQLMDISFQKTGVWGNPVLLPAVLAELGQLQLMHDHGNHPVKGHQWSLTNTGLLLRQALTTNVQEQQRAMSSQPLLPLATNTTPLEQHLWTPRRHQ